MTTPKEHIDFLETQLDLIEKSRPAELSAVPDGSLVRLLNPVFRGRNRAPPDQPASREDTSTRQASQSPYPTLEVCHASCPLPVVLRRPLNDVVPRARIPHRVRPKPCRHGSRGRLSAGGRDGTGGHAHTQRPAESDIHLEADIHALGQQPQRVQGRRLDPVPAGEMQVDQAQQRKSSRAR